MRTAALLKWTRDGRRTERLSSGKEVQSSVERARLKNIIILILALVNAILLIALASTRIQENTAKRRLTTQIVTMFKKNGISLNADDIPESFPPAGGTLRRNTAEERAMAISLLGKLPKTDNAGGGIYTYSTSKGTATFRSGGSFDITGKLGSAHLEKLCRDFCGAYGYENLKLSLKDGNGQGMATQYYGGHKIVNCTVYFFIKGGALVSVSGTHAPNPGTRFSSSVSSMTAATALTRFLEAHRQNGTVVSRVRRVFPCYRLKSSVSAPLTLTAVWRIVTDTGSYDINCATGAVAKD